MTLSTARRRWALVALPVGALLALSACSSGSVGGASPSASSSTSANPYSAIIPKGDIVAASKSLVSQSVSASKGFTPPSGGPKAQKPGATIAFVGSDLTNGGVAGVEAGVQEAAKVIGWNVHVYDGRGTAQGQNDAMSQAIASTPAAIIVGGFDATQATASIKQATSAGIPVVGWHAATDPGPTEGLYANVTTDPLKVSQLAAAYAVATSDGKSGAVIFTDSEFAVAVAKAKAMEAYIKACSGCSVLAYEDTPIADTDAQMPGIISTLLQKYGKKMTDILAINGAYLGSAQPSLKAANVDPAGPPRSIAAGDGDSAEFQRIRTGQYQAATVAEPLTLQGWELVDEINRALAKAKWSGFVAEPGLITKANVPSGDVFDPDSGYRDIYKKNWGK